jgi:hypothetical protein
MSRHNKLLTAVEVAEALHIPRLTVNDYARRCAVKHQGLGGTGGSFALTSRPPADDPRLYVAGTQRPPRPILRN